MPAEELTAELREFRLEMREGMDKLDKKMRIMLERKNSDKKKLATILSAVAAGARIKRPARNAAGLVAAGRAASRDDALLTRYWCDARATCAQVKSGVKRDKKLAAAARASAKHDKKLMAAVQDVQSEIRRNDDQILGRRA